PTDKTIAATYRRIMRNNRPDNILPQWGDAIVWNEFHMSTEFPIYWD
ncbi:IS256 family transposase, partial [Veillonella ratti]|nr:IS256 family transposase [Veillonella ratti]MCB5757769.1 IS256 family transposase [Veillonella ratti]MCB5758185.1 IS256 family transposase [Veillonella ratti]MCB5758522.1 IS256 family transposase [Veillonella ratti]MCB5758562.1 IS256 family transposase [Veillonella ratti]